MKVACCTPDIKVPKLGTLESRFGSKEARFFLTKCINFNQLKQVHARIIRFGLTNDQSLMRKLLKLFSFYGKLDYATLVFDQINDPDTLTCNVIIRLHSLSDSPEKALLLFNSMLCQGFVPDNFTFPFVINACRASSALDFGRVVHGIATKMRFWGDMYVQNTMMNLYFDFENVDDACKVFDRMLVRNVFSWSIAIAGLAACGKLQAARRLFEQMPSRNFASWNAMIDGYVKHEQPIEAFNLFERMLVDDDVRPNESTVVSLVRACTEMGSLKLGRCIHQFAIKNGLELWPSLRSALIDMYSKCGSLDDARTVFHTQVRNLATWNTMITSLGVHGFRNEAISVFEEMVKANVAPDAITFVGVLSACNDLEQGQKYFNLMTDRYGITPIDDHYKCMDKLHTRATNVDGIYKLGNPGELSMF